MNQQLIKEPGTISTGIPSFKIVEEVCLPQSILDILERNPINFMSPNNILLLTYATLLNSNR